MLGGAAVAALALVAGGCRSGVVTYVVDGDTLDVDRVRVRVLGIDTPERGQCGYAEAKARLRALVGGRRVTVVPAKGPARDRYGRELGYVDRNGLDAGRVLIAEGLAHARYDSLDGYGYHPRQNDYRRLDAATRNRCE